MESFSVISSYVLVLSVLTVLMMVILLRQQRSPRDLPIWLMASVAGVLLGAAASAALVYGFGYDVVERQEPIPEGAAPRDPNAPVPMGRPAAAGGPATGGGMGGMMGGGGARSPKRQLTTLVRKLDLLTGDIEIDLTPEQATEVNQLLTEIEAAEKMTDDEAKAKYDQLVGLLTEEQKEKEAAVGLPGGGGGGGRGGGMGGMGGMMGGMGGMMKGGPPGGPGGGEPDDNNPFTTEENKKSLEALRARLGGASESAQPSETEAGTASSSTASSSAESSSAESTTEESTTEESTTEESTTEESTTEESTTEESESSPP